MNWTLWILSSAVFLAFYDIAKKASVRGNSVLPVLLCSTSFGCAAFALSLWLRSGPDGCRLAAALAPGGRVLALAAVKSVIVATSWIFTFTALRTLPVTIATPIRASAPALVFLAALFLYGERPTWMQALGMLFVFSGYFAFSWAGRREGIDFLRDRSVWYAFAGMFFSACAALFDKFVFGVCSAPVDHVQLWFQIDLIAVYALTFAGSKLVGHVPSHRFEFRWTIPFVGVLLAAADWLYFTGIADPAAPISVASLLRRFSVVITFVLGARFFRETNLRRKALALAAILAGVALLCASR